MARIQSYSQFWPFYLGEHANSTNRRLHFIGTSIAFLLLISSLVMSNGWFFLAAVISGYAFAWVGHFKFEKNKPASFGYPLWSFVSDWRMWFLILTRQKLYSKESNAAAKSATEKS